MEVPKAEMCWHSQGSPCLVLAMTVWSPTLHREMTALTLLHPYEIPAVGFGVGTIVILNVDLLEQKLELHLNKPGKAIGWTVLYSCHTASIGSWVCTIFFRWLIGFPVIIPAECSQKFTLGKMMIGAFLKKGVTFGKKLPRQHSEFPVYWLEAPSTDCIKLLSTVTILNFIFTSSFFVFWCLL